MTTIVPPTLERPATASEPPSPEVLFKEARRRRRRRWIVAVLCVTAVGTGVGAGTSIAMRAPQPRQATAHGEGTRRAYGAPPPCRPAQLEVTVSGSTAAAIYSGVVLTYRDASRRACTLEGYPKVTGVTAATGRRVTARHELRGYLGGLAGGRGSITEPPRVVLRGPGPVASSTVEWSSVATYTEVSPRCIGVGHHAMVIDELRVVVDGGSPKVLKTPATTAYGFGALCYEFRADPYVPGAKGKWL